ncbi:hypothetical protein Ctob_004536 [Chrysochromulina tobinii]|uniref:Uncharacterized protein n=1 Tax=Chrysochromulina tobinii TaxID=1460289 RepID=A0A0M0JTT3_9EUKA|nr:hypothetical protein Ctob_004536 [Chrysochromulina tobinii]|eukprot:KOO29762.1 hypothetical protein Ctob_004536 [Chrysochromulina sp. CCMP291]
MEEDGPFPQAVTRLRALQSAAQVYRRARELSAQDATPVEPTARSAMTPNRGRHTMTTFASPRQLAERELASTIRQLRLVQGGGGAAALDAHSMPAAMRTPASLQTPLESETERRRHAKSHLEAQLLEALDSAAGLGHEREELLDALRAAEATAEAAAAETERLRDEVATLQLELEEERLRAMSAAEELEAEARELAEQLELERARLNEERYTTAVIRAAYEERSAEFEQLRWACVRTALHGTGIEAVAHLAIDAAGTHVATVQGVDVVVYAVDASHRLTAVQRLSLDPPDAPPGLRESTPDPQNLPNAFKPYHACFSPDGKLLAVGMEDGALLLFGASSLIVAAAIAGKEAAADSAVVDVTAEASAARDARPWTLLWRSRQHSKELKAAAFAPDGSLLLTAAPDGKCLALAIPLEGGTKRAPAPLFGAVNFGAGWVVRCDVRSGRSTSYVKIGSAPLTTLACSSDGRMVAAGDNDGALHLVDGRTLTKLLKVVPHEIWITGLLLRAAPPSGLATLAKATEPRAYTAVTLGGDNTCVFTTVPSTKLKGGGGLLGSPLFWLSVLVLLVALVVQYPGEATIVGARVLSLTHEALRLAGPYLSLPAPVTAPVEAMGQPTGATPMEAQAP